MNGHSEDNADINTSVVRILPINSMITVGTIVKSCGEILLLFLNFLTHGIDIDSIVAYSLPRQHDLCEVPNIWFCSQQARSQN